jgi:hypothetical protein
LRTVQEAQRRPAGGKQSVVQQRNHARHDWRRRAGAIDRHHATVDDDLEVLRLCGELPEVRQSVIGACRMRRQGLRPEWLVPWS